LLREFVAALRRVPPLERAERDMARMLGSAAASDGPAPSLPARAGSYTRTCAYVDERFEVLLLDWSPGAASEIHDHGGQHCWFVVLQGCLRVDDYGRVDAGDVPGKAVLEARGSRLLGPGDLDLRSGRFDIHRVAAGETRALTLHVYARPLHAYLLYDQRAQSCRPSRGTYDRVLSLIAASQAVR
jgi:predicted metal-dependent enzyme (double-stranded beta helix superfamily)